MRRAYRPAVPKLGRRSAASEAYLVGLFEDTNLSAAILGTVRILNADFVNGECGLYACDADGDREIRRVTYRDTDSGERWSWPPRRNQVFGGPDDFIHIL